MISENINIPIPPAILGVAFKSMPLMIAMMAAVMKNHDYLLSGYFFKVANTSDGGAFDYIIIGGGSAGAVVASRLSENPKVRVLLLEAGGDPSPFTYVPAFAAQMPGNPDIDWMYKTEPQDVYGNGLGLTNKQLAWHRGKAVGGTSTINYMIYMRGCPKDFDRWAEHTNDSRWSHKTMETYFRKMEDYEGYWKSEGYHGQGGPLRVEGVRYTPGLQYVLDAGKEVGMDTRDLNHDQKQGFTPVEHTMKRGFRYSVFRAYIQPALKRENFEVYRYAHVTKIHLNEDKRAVGVSYMRHGTKGYVRANKEIILSAGSFSSPHLLMLSGIGPKEHLEEHKIKPIVDLPAVGQNLQDHVTTIVGPFLFDKPESFMPPRDLTLTSGAEILINGSGPISSAMGVIAVGVASTKSTPDWPDVMYTVISLGVFDGIADSFQKLFHLEEKSSTEFFRPDIGKDAHTVLVTLGLPESRGVVKLRDKNPMTKPYLDPKYYTDAGNRDLDMMLKGVALIRKMYEETNSMKKLNSRLSRPYPGCEKFPMESVGYNECLLRTLTVTEWHQTSTCSMGRADDPNAVVDPQLRVRGVTGLRVADASVMPFVTNANTNAPTIAIGEAAAEIIKADWKEKDEKREQRKKKDK